MKIKDLKKGDFFTRTPNPDPKDSQVWIRGDYDREAKRYECTRFDNICVSVLLPGDKDVYTEFVF